MEKKYRLQVRDNHLEDTFFKRLSNLDDLVKSP